MTFDPTTNGAQSHSGTAGSGVGKGTANGPFRILLVDPEVLVRYALGKLITTIPGCEIGGQVNDPEAAFRALRDDERIRLVVFEIALPGMSGIEFLRELQRRQLSVKTLAVSHVSSPDMITQALLAGAQGYVLKSGVFEELVEAIETVRSGNKRYLPPAIAHLAEVAPNSYGLSPEPDDPLADLSSREREVFHLLANGLQNTEIAKKLFISPRTVETHRARVVRKLGLSTNGELIRFAIKHGLSLP